MQTVKSHPSSLITESAVDAIGASKAETLTGRLQSSSLLNLGSALVIAIAVALGLYGLKPPAAAGLSAPATEFSATRAMKHVQTIAKTPRPVGSDEHNAAREYIVNELRALGVEPEVQEALAVGRRPTLANVANVRNVVGVLKGTGNSKSVLLASHYDSVARGPGAGDDGAAVAAMLETLRALKSSAPLQNDVIFLFTDAEEAGLLGARAFLKHPLAKNVGLALNLDARGSSGPAMMYETSEGNGWLINEFGKAAPNPVASSLFYDLYKLMPNDTDMTMFKAVKIPGLNFAFIGDYLNYHSTFDTVDRLDQNTLQHQGASTLALTRHFGNLDLRQTQATSDATYFDVLGTVLISYSRFWNVVLTVLVTILFVAVLVVGLKKGELRIVKVALGAVAFLLSAVVVVAAITFLWRLIRTVHAGYQVLPEEHTYNSHLYLIGFASLALALTTVIYTFYLKFISMPNLAMGALLWWVILAILSWRFFPGGNYLLVWPLLFSLGALAFWFVAKQRPVGNQVALSLCAAPGIVLLTPLIYLTFIGLGWSLITGVIAAILLALSLLVPNLCLMLKANRYVVPGVALLVAIGFLVAGSVTAGFDKQRPKPNVVFYGLNADTGAARWMSTDPRPDEWTSQFFSKSSGDNVKADYLPFQNERVLAGEAPVVQLAAPTLKITSDTNDGSLRTITMRIASARQAPTIVAYVNPGVEIADASINGSTAKLPGVSSSERGWGLRYHGLPADGAELTLKVPTGQPVQLRLIDQSFKLPDVPVRPRPDYMQPGLFAYSDTTLVTKSFSF